MWNRIGILLAVFLTAACGDVTTTAMLGPDAGGGETGAAGGGGRLGMTSDGGAGAGGTTGAAGRGGTTGTGNTVGAGNTTGAGGQGTGGGGGAGNSTGCSPACPPFAVCNSGSCACTGTGQMLCGSPANCINTAASSANCGSCGHACTAGMTCTNGSCTGGGSAGTTGAGGSGSAGATGSVDAGPAGCPGGGQKLCDNTCVDTTGNASHCGACNNACQTGFTCVGGICTSSPTGNTSCGFSPNRTPCYQPAGVIISRDGYYCFDCDVASECWFPDSKGTGSQSAADRGLCVNSCSSCS